MGPPKFLDAWMEGRWAIGFSVDLHYAPRIWMHVGPVQAAVDFSVPLNWLLRREAP